MSYKPKIKTVSEGGSGKASTTSYAVQCGGTSSTSAFQDIASVGTSGQVLISNGAGVLPTFQTSTGSGLIVWWAGSSGNPGDSVTVRLIVNNSTNVDISTTVALVTSPRTFSNASLSQAVSAGDYLQLVWITPAWATNPLIVKFSMSLYIET